MSCASAFYAVCRKKPNQSGKKEKKETRNKSHCGYRHDSCQSGRKSPANEKVFYAGKPHLILATTLIVPGFQLAEQVIL